MLQMLIAAQAVVLLITLLTDWLVYWRVDSFAQPAEIARHGGDRAARDVSFGMGLLALLFGLVVSIAYIWFAARWPETTSQLYRGFGLSLAAILSITAVVRPRLQVGGVWEVIALHLLWGLGYGWLMPLAVGAFTTR